MNFFKDFDWSFKSIAKIFGMIILGVIALSIVISLISFSFKTIFNFSNYNNNGYEVSNNMMYEESFGEAKTMRAEPTMAINPNSDYSPGNDAENFEVKNYNATIKTSSLDSICETISNLKSRKEIIFESANHNDKNCNYQFKVEKAYTEEILAIIEGLDPEDINENIKTIKKSVEVYDTQLDILKKKLSSIEETLEKAQNTYDEVTKLATKKQDVESLTTIINNKLNLIDKLTNERMNIKQQIDLNLKSKADQLDKLKYSFFSVFIYEDKILDLAQIKESWNREIKNLIQNFNDMLQGISLNLLTYLIRFVEVAIYLFLSLFLLKFVWFAVKKIWKGKKRQ